MTTRARQRSALSKAITVAAVSALFLTACAAGGSETPDSTPEPSTNGDGVSALLSELREAGFIQIAMPNQPPFSGVRADGSLEGLTPAVIGDIMAELGVPEVQAAVAPYGQLIPGLQSNRWDLSGGALTMTAERCEQAIFSRPVLWDGSAIVYDPSRLATPPTSLTDLIDQGLKVGMVVSSLRIPVAIEHGMLESNITQFPDDPAIYDAIRTGRVDAAFIANSSVRYHLGAETPFDVVYPVPETPPNPAALAFRLSDEAFAAEFDAAFTEYIAAGKLKERQDEFGFVTPDGVVDRSAAEICADLKAAG